MGRRFFWVLFFGRPKKSTSAVGPKPDIKITVAAATQHKQPTSILIVKPQLRNQQRIPGNLINDSMLVVNPPRPIAGQAVFQRFRLTDALERLALDFFDQLVDAFKNGFVGGLPVEVAVPGIGRKGDFHSINSRSVPWPDSSSAMDSSKWRALAGERSR